MGSVHNFNRGESNDLAKSAFAKLEQIFSLGEPVSIATSLKNYENMVIESLSAERGVEKSASLHFKVVAKQIVRFDQALLSIPKPKKARVAAKKTLGRQETKPASKKVIDELKKRSALSSFKNWLDSSWK